LEVLKEIYRVLKPGCVLILSAPQNYWLHNDPEDLYRFSQQGLTEIVQRHACFKINYINSLGGTREFLIDFICKYIHIQLSTGILGKIIPATLKKLIVTLPQILYLKLFKNTDVNILFSLGNILVAVK
jgi:SAM-dependent methyltransferase